MRHQELITQFQQQAPARIAQLGRLAAVSIESRVGAEKQLRIIKNALRALAVVGSVRAKLLIISAARDRAGVGLDFPTLSQVGCNDCQPINTSGGIGLPVSDSDVRTEVSSLGTLTLRQRLADIYDRIQASTFTPINTTNGRNFDFPNTSGRPHKYDTLDEFVRAVVFRYEPVKGTLTHNRQGQVFKAGDLIPSLRLELSHTQGGNPVVTKRITDTSGTSNTQLVEQTGNQITNPTIVELTNVGLSSQHELRPGGRRSREFTGFIQDQRLNDRGGVVVQPRAYVDFVLPSYLFKTTTDLASLSPENRGTVIRSAGQELVIAQGTYTSVGATFNNEFVGYAFPASYGNLSFIGQQADGFTTNILNIGAFRRGQHFNATISYTGSDGLIYSAPYLFIWSSERLTAPNNFRFGHPEVALPSPAAETTVSNPGSGIMLPEDIRDALNSLPLGSKLTAGAIDGLPASSGDMQASVYDTNGDGKVNSADSADTVPWAGVTGKPTLVTATDVQTQAQQAQTNAIATLRAGVPAAGDTLAKLHTLVTGKVNSAVSADTVPWTGVTGRPTIPANIPSEAQVQTIANQAEANAVSTLRDGVAAAGNTLAKLYNLITGLQTLLTSDNASLDTLQELVDFVEINRDTLTNLTIASIAGLQAALDARVPNTRTVAGKALSSNVTLVKGDVGLANVDNTADSDKPVSTAQSTAIATAQNNAVSTVRGGVAAAGDTLAKLLTLINGKADTVHNHDDRYYTEAEVDSMIAAIPGGGGGGGGLADAPSDGLPYVRRNAAWESVSRFMTYAKTVTTERATNSIVKDEHMESETLEVNSIYRVELLLLFTGGTVEDMRFNVQRSGLGDATLRMAGDLDNASAATFSFNATQNCAVATSGVWYMGNYIGMLTTGASTGTIFVQWGQQTTGATVARMGEGSMMMLRKVGSI